MFFCRIKLIIGVKQKTEYMDKPLLSLY